MKVAHVLPWVSRQAGGLFNSVSGLAKASQQSLGLQVEVFGSQDEFAGEDRQRWQPLDVHLASVCGSARFCYTPEMRGLIEGFAPDLIHSAAVWTYQAAVVNQVHARHKTPYVLSPRGTLDPWALRHSGWKKTIALRLFQQRHFDRAACLHALSEAELTSIRHFGLKNPVCVIPNGIDLPEIGKAETLKTEILKGKDSDTPLSDVSAFQHFSVSAFADSGRKILLYLGRIHPKKGLVNLLKAWAKVQKSGIRGQWSEEWVLAMAGWDEGGHELELKTLATELGVQWTDVREKAERLKTEILKTDADSDFSISASQRFSVFFLGPQFGEAKAACYRACDAFVLPSFSEGLPMVLLEAWAYGKPVLMTPECNLPQGFTANAALRIETNPESIAAGLKEMCRLADLSSPLRPDRGEVQGEGLKPPPCSALCHLGINGRKLVAEKYAWPTIAREMKSVYDWVLGGGPKPGCVTLD